MHGYVRSKNLSCLTTTIKGLLLALLWLPSRFVEAYLKKNGIMLIISTFWSS